MSDTTTELEVLDEIVDVLGGQSGQYETVVPTLQQILALLGGGGGGYNPSLSVGRADALTGADETAQWAQRTTEGNGAATVRSVQGAAVVWGQLVKIVAGQQTSSGVAITKRADGTVTVSGTAASNVYFHLAGASYVPPLVAGNKYLVRGPQQGNSVAIHIPGNTGFNNAYDSQIITAVSSGTATSNIYVMVTAGFDGELTFTPQLFDLTALYGAGNEPTTVAEFEQMYPEAYYPYSAPTLKPVQIAGIRSTDAQGGELDAIEWTAQTLRAAGSVADMLYSDHVDVRVGVVVIDGVNVKAYGTYPISGVTHAIVDMGAGTMSNEMSKVLISCDKLPAMSGTQEWVETLGICVGSDRFIRFVTPDIAEATSAADLNAWLQQNPLTCFYAIATPTTTPISPALPMTYKVQQGGSESIIVPDGEVSAAPILIVAEGESAADVVMDALACIAAPDGQTATANHAVNTYLTMGGKLYKVTSAIAVGETITAGTNVTETTVMAELIARTA